tara:strand:- start:62 stop:295 length:234 start_codon:yes stop_codon:yes gene_type:complete
MVWVPPPNGKRGRQHSFSDAAIQTCLTMKVLFGLYWATPNFSTLCRRQNMLNVSLPYRSGTGPLNLLTDSTGIKVGK